MHPDELVEQVRAGGLLPPGSPVLVMLSGGRDSVCLLDVAVRLAGASAVSALHVNYRLRPDADGDEAHCAALCQALGVPLEVTRPRKPARAGNLQAWARDARYGAAARLALTGDARVAAGHTFTDQAETVLYRLATSPGRRALLGMAPRDGRLVRPLLGVTREETAAYCRGRRLAWREDPSNADRSRYARARVREDLMPALRSLHPAAELNVVHTAQLLRDEAEVLDALVDGVLEGADAIDLERLRGLPPALARLAVRRLAGDAAAPATRLEEILGLRDTGSASLDLGDGLRAVVEYGRLRFTTAPPPQPPDAVRLPIPGEVRFGEWDVACRRAPVSAGADVFDAAALRGPVTVRAWCPGDRVGSRSLGDLFTDRRVPREARRAMPVVECDGEIAWVPGVAAGKRFTVTSSTEEAVLLTAHTAR